MCKQFKNAIYKKESETISSMLYFLLANSSKLKLENTGINSFHVN